MTNRITADKRKEEFYWAEAWFFVSFPDEETGKSVELSSTYVPTSMDQVKKETGIWIRDITIAKLRYGMYPFQKAIKNVLAGTKQ